MERRQWSHPAWDILHIPRSTQRISMRQKHLYAVLSILAVVGCREAYSPIPEGVTPPPPRVILPACRTTRMGNEPEFARIIAVMKLNGEVERANAFYLQMRRDIEASIGSSQPAALARLRPALDAFFSGAEIERKAVCPFSRFDQVPVEIAIWESWASDPAMRDIHARIMRGVMSPSLASGSPRMADDARRALIDRMLVATDYRELVSALLSAQRQAHAVTETALDPTSSILQDIERNSPVVMPPEADALADEWLGPSLHDVSDEDLTRFLQFAESRAGRNYYRMVRETYAYSMTDWYARLGTMLASAMNPPETAHDPEMAATKISEARRLLDKVGTRVVFPDARSLLLEAERLDPDNAEIQLLLGRVGKTIATKRMIYEPDRLRLTVEDLALLGPEIFAEVETRLAKAIELDPEDAEAQLHMGHLRFLQSRDEDAVRYFAQARKLDSSEPGLKLFEAGLHYEQGRLRDAERLLRKVLAEPEGRAYDYYYALMQLRLILDRQGRGREYDAAVASQLKRHPRMWDVRIEQAKRMIRNGARSSEVLAMIDPVPDGWLPDVKQALLFDMSVRQVAEAPASTRDAAAKRVFENADNPMRALDAVCMAGGRQLIAGPMIRASGKPEVFADGLMACTMRNEDIVLGNAILPFIRDIDRPNAGLEGKSPLCEAVGQLNRNLIEWLLTRTKTDPAKPCAGGKTPRDLIQEITESAMYGEGYRATARNMLNEYDRMVRDR